MNRSPLLLLLAVPALILLSGCGGDAVAGSPSMQSGSDAVLQGPQPLSAVQALDYCDAFMGWEKIDCLERVAQGKDPSYSPAAEPRV